MEWPAPGIFPTMRRSASTRSTSCHRGCSPDVPNRPSSTGSWASSTALDRRHTRSWRTDMRIVSIVSGAVLLCVSVAAAQTPRTTPAACDALRQLQVSGVALTVTKAEWFAAGAPLPGGRGGAAPVATKLPAYCRLDGVIDRRMGAGATYGIGFALALPEDWN